MASEWAHAEESAYELQRLETIRKNNAFLASLGIVDDVNALAAKPKPKPRAAPKPKAPAVASRRRASGRLAGEVPGEAIDGEDGEEAVPQHFGYRDPNDVGEMTALELRDWCANVLTEEKAKSWVEELTEVQRARVMRACDEWIPGFTEFTARFGSAKEGPLSRQNIKSVVKQVLMLVSGAGVRHERKQTVFAEGKPLTLGVTASDCDALRAAAQLWMPQTSAPADLVGMVVDGVTVNRKPDGGPFDTSNGWLLNHPLKKMQIYCKHLDEVSRRLHPLVARALSLACLCGGVTIPCLTPLGPSRGLN
jgi:hypothetical protein